jgi:hypothetical protein
VGNDAVVWGVIHISGGNIHRLTCHLTDFKRAYIGGSRWLKWIMVVFLAQRFSVTLRRHSINLHNVLDLSKTNQLDQYEIFGSK